MKKIIISTILWLLCAASLAYATDGFVAYRSNTGANTLNSPKIRFWNNSANNGNGSWGNEIELQAGASAIRFLVLKQSHVNSKVVLVTQNTLGNLDGYVCMEMCNESTNWNYTGNISTVGVGNQRRFNFDFEKNHSDVLLVYSVVNTNTARDLAYQILTNDNLTFTGLTENYIDDTGHAADQQYSWIEMDSNPVADSNEIIFAGFDTTNNDINAWVWNGTGIGPINEINASATATGGGEALAVRYAADGSKGMVVGAAGTNGFIASEYWSGGAWTVVPGFDIDGTDTVDAQWITMKEDPSSDDLQLVVQDNAATPDMGTSYWNGAVWTMTSNIDTAMDLATARNVDFAWNITGGTGQLVWDTDAATANISYRTCTPQCNVAGLINGTFAGTGAWISLYTNPTASSIVQFLGLRLNSNFDIGSFRYNGINPVNYTNYGDSVITADTTVTTFESYSFDYVRDTRQPNVTFISPNQSGITISNNSIFFNISSNEYLTIALLEWNLTTNYSMNGTHMSWNYTLLNLSEGFYTYKIFATDLANNTNISITRNITINNPPNITIISPANNTFNATVTSFFFFNVTDYSDNVSMCSLIIDSVIFINTSTSPVNETNTLNLSYNLSNGQHNWSIFCNDTAGLNSTVGVFNISISLLPQILLINIDEGIAPLGNITLAAGTTRSVGCNVTISDPYGPANIFNVTAKLFHLSNSSTDPDDYNYHYSNYSCTIGITNPNNRSYDCSFNMYYFANNGTWVCEVQVYNNQTLNSTFNATAVVLALYALNITADLNYGNVAAGSISENITANITNIGNMNINLTLQGYAISVGDSIGMNCSDGSNITIGNMKYSTTVLDYASKTPLDGTVQNLGFTVNKPTSITTVSNITYWQLMPDPGAKNRYCSGYVVFSAEIS